MLQNKKVIYSGRKQVSCHLGMVGQAGVGGRNYKGHFGGDGYVHCIGFHGHIQVNLSNYTLWVIVYQLFNKQFKNICVTYTGFLF